jgi:signal transduction histidine kinase
MNVVPYEIRDPHEVLTDEVIINLLLVFHQFGLSMKDVYVKLVNIDWQRFPLANIIDKLDFCSYARNTKPFAELCARDREDCRKLVMKRINEPVQWYCPFGLRVMGIGFQVGQAQIVLRSEGWLEQGNEGLAINKTLEILHQFKSDHLQNQILPLFRKQRSRTDAEVRRDAESLKGLFGLVRDQADAVYRRNLDRSKEDFLRELRMLVIPLMAESDVQMQRQQIKKTLDNIKIFFRLDGCAFYFTKTDDHGVLNLIASNGVTIGSVYNRIDLSTLGTQGLTNVGSERILSDIDFAGTPKPRSKACIFTFPNMNIALLWVWPVVADISLLDDFMLSALTRALGDPICVASLVTVLEREANLRRMQARNTAHTVRTIFQGILWDAADVRLSTTAVLGKMPNKVEESIEHMEELIQFMSNLLQSYEIVENLFSKGTRTLQFMKKEIKVSNILVQARESLRKMAQAFNIEIVLHKSIQELTPVDADENLISLVFIHLLHNALKYSHRGSLEKKRTVDVTGHEDASNIYVEITDFGLGVHPLEKETIFQPYVQGSIIDETRSITGQGIGLATAREVVKIHGGDVVLERCIPYRNSNERIQYEEILSFKPGSQEASELLQHCLVVFEVSLPKRRI